MAGYKFDYESKVWGGETLRISPFHFRASRLYFALQAFKNTKGKLLDVGCGAGDFPEAFSFYRPDLKIFAFDISKKAIALAKKRKSNIEFKVASAEKIPYPNNYFDIVTCFDVIEHVRDSEEVLKEIVRVLKKGGTFQTFIPAEDSWFSPEGFLIKIGWKAKEIYGGHPHHYSREYIRKILKSSGFRIKKVLYGEHFTNQIIEIIYFSFLSLRGRNTDSSVEGYIARSKRGPETIVLGAVKNLLSAVSYFEARLLGGVPGGLGVHITCIKK